MTSRRAIRRANRRGRPNRLCSRTVELAVLTLPHGEIRGRWERELIAEMYEMDLKRQAGYAVMTLATSWSLRRSLTGRDTGGNMTVKNPRKPFLCLLNLKHHWERGSTEDGGRFWHCTRCGKDRSGVGNTSNYPMLGG